MDGDKHKNISFQNEKNVFYVRIMINSHFYLKTFKTLEEAISYRDDLIRQHRAMKEPKENSAVEHKKTGRPPKTYTVEEMTKKIELEKARRQRYYEKHKDEFKAKYQENKDKIKERYEQKKAEKIASKASNIES